MDNFSKMHLIAAGMACAGAVACAAPELNVIIQGTTLPDGLPSTLQGTSLGLLIGALGLSGANMIHYTGLRTTPETAHERAQLVQKLEKGFGWLKNAALLSLAYQGFSDSGSVFYPVLTGMLFYCMQKNLAQEYQYWMSPPLME